MTCFVLHSMVDMCWLVECALRFVCVEIGGMRIGGVYGRCGERLHDMERWLEGIQEVVGGALDPSRGLECALLCVVTGCEERSERKGPAGMDAGAGCEVGKGGGQYV